MGQGGKILLANKTPYRWKRTHEESYQMAYWVGQAESFPLYIEPGQTSCVYVEWDQRIGKYQSDDNGKVRYELENTNGLQFEIHAVATNGFELKIHLVNFSTDAVPQNGDLSLGWQHDGMVFFALAGPKEQLSCYGPGLHAKRWLTFIDDETRLTDLTLPGTHDTCTYRVGEGALKKLSDTHIGALAATLPSPLSAYAAAIELTADIVSNSAECQTLSLTEQLEKGIRFLDIRLKNIDNKLKAYHSGVPLDMDFDEIVDTCRAFLDAHSDESIIMSIKCEDSSKDASDISVLVKAKINKNQDSWYFKNQMPNLGEIRNRIVLMRRYSAAPNESAVGIGIDCTHWPDNVPFTHTNSMGISFDIQDEYRTFMLGQLEHKFNNSVLPNMNRAIVHSNKIFINFLSGGGAVFPSTLAKGTYSTFGGTNLLMSQHIRAWNTNRLGIVVMDYPEYPANGTLIHQLIALNTFSQHVREKKPAPPPKHTASLA